MLYKILFYSDIQTAIPFWPENDTKRLKIKVEGCLLPPRTIDFTRPENCLLLHLDDSVSTPCPLMLSNKQDVLHKDLVSICDIWCSMFIPGKIYSHYLPEHYTILSRPLFVSCLQVGGIIVDVNLSEHSATIRFSEYHDGAAPFLIINHTKDQTLLFHQRWESIKF